MAVAENTADELARSDGREVQLEEDPDLQLPFLLPEDGYSCDVVRSLPNGLQDFLDPLLQRGNVTGTTQTSKLVVETHPTEHESADGHFVWDIFSKALSKKLI